MTVSDFLKAHGLTIHPFAEEEAQNDLVLSRLLERDDFGFQHDSWDKVLGTPPGVGTSQVYGSKGSGKTAMRAALELAIERHNQAHPDDRTFLVKYDEFNSRLTAWKRDIEERHARERSGWFRRRRKDSGFASLEHDWMLQDQIDSVLSCCVKTLVDMVLAPKSEFRPRKSLSAINKQGLMLVACLYLAERPDAYHGMMAALRRRVFGRWTREEFGRAFANLLSLGVALGVRHLGTSPLAKTALARIRVVDREKKDLQYQFKQMSRGALRDQPVITGDDESAVEDHRYVFLERFFDIVSDLGFKRVVVLVDRVDEPTMINGDYDRMTALVRPLWNNKLLQLRGYHFKLLLPVQLYDAVRSASREEGAGARWDKQKIIWPFEWSGEELFEMLSRRMQVCRDDKDKLYPLDRLLDEELTRQEVIESLKGRHQPRMAMKFVHDLIAHACKTHDPTMTEAALPRVPRRVFYEMTTKYDLLRPDYERTYER